MAGFFEFVQVCFSSFNLPFTVGLIGIFLYWILFIVGAVGLDDVDVDMDLDVDADVDLDLDVDADVDVDVDAGTAGDVGSGASSFWVSFLRFFNVGDVPIMVLASVLVASLWTISLLGNYYLNRGNSVLIALGLLAANFVLSLLITKVVTAPIRHFFKHANSGTEAPAKIVGKTCIITTGEVSPKFGAAQIQPEDGPPIALNVRCSEGTILRKGDEAVVTDHDPEKNTYTVIPFNLEVS